MSFLALARTSSPLLLASARPCSLHFFPRTITTSASMLNTIDEIILDHNQIKKLYMRYKDATSLDERSSLVNTIIREIAVHSEAEEATVYNSLEKQNKTDAAHFRDEHQKLEEVLYSVDYTKVDAPEFPAKFDHAIRLFLQHSAEEESAPGQLAKLSQTLSPSDNDALAKKFLEYRNLVPTRPHPAAPQSGGIMHKVGGLLTKPHDKIMETLQGRKFVDLEYTHPAKGKMDPLDVPARYMGLTSHA